MPDSSQEDKTLNRAEYALSMIEIMLCTDATQRSPTALSVRTTLR